jgi:hypothetical protein
VSGSCDNPGIACDSGGNDGGVCCTASQPFPGTCNL